jgi:hypothetical protein
MKKAIAFASCLLLLVALSSCGGGNNLKQDTNSNEFSYGEKSGDTKPVRDRAEGVAAIFDNDRALARDRAINDARNKLVEKVLGTTVSGASLVENFQLVKMLIEEKSYGLVKNEKILSENFESDMCRVMLEGTVLPAVAEDAIENALNRYGRPKFMILINETFEGHMNAPGFTETEMLMQERMGSAGFEFVDAQIVQDLMKRQYGQMSRAMTGQISQDVQDLLLNDNGAEVIIIGTAQTKDQSRALEEYTKVMKSKSAIVRLKAIDMYTGRVLATTSKDAPGAHTQSDTASKRAIEAVLKKIIGGKDEGTGVSKPGPFMAEIIKQFVKSATHRPINVYITGLNYDGLKEFREQISHRVRGVQQVNDKGRVGAAARLEVLFTGTTMEFTDELKAKSEKLGFQVEIPQSFPNRVTLQAKQMAGK